MNMCVIIVTHNPDVLVLNQVISSLSNQAKEIFIYKNSQYSFRSINNVFFFGDGRNIGIGRAQNFLLKIAIKNKYDFVLMSDQDTIYPKNYSYDMISVFPDDNLTAALSPAWSNFKANVNYNGFHILKNNKLQHDKRSKNIIPISHCISSGMLIRVKCIRDIGFFDEKFFIDWVDNEWCWRVNSKGYKILGNPNVVINHDLGDKSVRLFNFRFTKRSTSRNYYIVRNAVYLFLYSEYSLFKPYIFKKIIHHFVFSIIFSDHRFNEFTMLSRSIIDGVNKKLGKVII